MRCGTAPYRSTAYLVAAATMRGAQLGCVYWLFCGIYLFAVLGSSQVKSSEVHLHGYLLAVPRTCTR